MPKSEHAITDVSDDVTAATFARDVIAASHQRPVLVDFWAAWCGPCQMLAPVLDTLVREYDGAIGLAKIDTDQERELAAQYGIRSLPTVVLFKDGAPVTQFTGAQPAATIRRLLDPHLPRLSDDIAMRAVDTYQKGDHEVALTLLRQAVESDPGNFRPRLKLVDLLAREGRFDKARNEFHAIADDARQSPEYRATRARLELGEAITDDRNTTDLVAAANREPPDLDALYQVALRQALAGEFEPALAQLLRIVALDRAYRDGAARLAIIHIFDLLGEGDLVSKYRSLLARTLN